jgi:peptidoglycan-N-acetylglucosamine deacetylase
MDGAADHSGANHSAAKSGDHATTSRGAARRGGALTPPALLLTVAGLAVFQAGPGLTALGPVRRAMFAGLSGRGAADHVALTFDDGPDPVWTPRFLELLDTRQIRATFFLLGSMTARAPGLAAQIAAAGHEIAVHGWDHRYLPLRGPRATYDDMRRARDTIADVTGATPRYFRPPYGVLSTASLAVAWRLGLTPVLWTCWAREWRPGSTPESAYAVLASGLAGGATVLLHDSEATAPPGSAAAALGAAALLLDDCRQRGLRVGPVGAHRIGSPGRGKHGGTGQPFGDGQQGAAGGAAAGPGQQPAGRRVRSAGPAPAGG